MAEQKRLMDGSVRCDFLLGTSLQFRWQRGGSGLVANDVKPGNEETFRCNVPKLYFNAMCTCVF